MKSFKNYNAFKEAWLIVSNLQEHTIKTLKGTKQEVSAKTFQRIKKELIKTLSNCIERINQL